MSDVAGCVAVLASLVVAGASLASKPVAPVVEQDVSQLLTSMNAQINPYRPRLLVVGDSYSGGSAEGGYGRRNWVSAAAAQLGMVPVNLSVGGTGFVNGMQDRPDTSFAARLPEVLRREPDVVVVAGGINDASSDPAVFDRRAAAFLRSARKGLPRARFVVVAPVWPSSRGGVPAGAVHERDTLRSLAREIRAGFVDPLAGEWFRTPQTRGLIGKDRVHPTDAGHAFMTRRMVRAIGPAPTTGR
jgi:lysophospholipase L1-like esterase